MSMIDETNSDDYDLARHKAFYFCEKGVHFREAMS
jgi:hypothetical protein